MRFMHASEFATKTPLYSVVAHRWPSVSRIAQSIENSINEIIYHQIVNYDKKLNSHLTGTPTLCSAIQVYIKQTAANVLALAGRPLTLVGHVCRSEKLPQARMDVSLNGDIPLDIDQITADQLIAVLTIIIFLLTKFLSSYKFSKIKILELIYVNA
ncbi:hypothetical protein T08_15772 [Trichinella sp. T8]|nr:hypothetical protein T08_15772 [Trichinella sp. T8]